MTRATPALAALLFAAAAAVPAPAGALVARELEGRALDRYELRAEIRIENKQFLGVDPLLAIVFPVGTRRVAWTFDNREMRIDGMEGRFLGMPTPGAWQQIALKVGPQGVEAYLGSQRVLAVPAEKVLSSPHHTGVDGLGFVVTSARRRVEIREPRIRIE